MQLPVAAAAAAAAELAADAAAAAAAAALLAPPPLEDAEPAAAAPPDGGEGDGWLNCMWPMPGWSESCSAACTLVGQSCSSQRINNVGLRHTWYVAAAHGSRLPMVGDATAGRKLHHVRVRCTTAFTKSKGLKAGPACFRRRASAATVKLET